ncbi:MAG: hypothetical protein HQL95_16570 [Magnetococcales bacterium]|nr:hypothetical protein [Magnetococcales bacterium]
MENILRFILIFLPMAMLSGCYSIRDIDTRRIEPNCVRECTVSYSTCINGGPTFGFKTEILKACQDAFVVCTGTCPSR